MIKIKKTQPAGKIPSSYKPFLEDVKKRIRATQNQILDYCKHQSYQTLLEHWGRSSRKTKKRRLGHKSHRKILY